MQHRFEGGGLAEPAALTREIGGDTSADLPFS